MIANDYLILLIGMGLVTYIPRWAPLFFLSQRNLPGWFVEWLGLIPASILSALLLPELITAGAPRQLVFQKELWVALPTFLVALKWRSLGGTVLAGMLLYWAAGKIL